MGSIFARAVSLPRCVPQLARREVKEYISAFSLYIFMASFAVGGWYWAKVIVAIVGAAVY